MPKERSVVQSIIAVAVFIILEAAAVLMLSNNNELQRLWIARISHGFMAKTWGTTQAVSNYFSLKRQNDELALENDMLRKKVLGYELAAKAADPDFRPVMMDNGFNYIPATIVKSSTNSQHNYLIIDKGSEDGVTRNSGVITSKGIIGIVDAVSGLPQHGILHQREARELRSRRTPGMGRHKLGQSHTQGNSAPVQVRSGRHGLHERLFHDLSSRHPDRSGR